MFGEDVAIRVADVGEDAAVRVWDVGGDAAIRVWDVGEDVAIRVGNVDPAPAYHIDAATAATPTTSQLPRPRAPHHSSGLTLIADRSAAE